MSALTAVPAAAMTSARQLTKPRALRPAFHVAPRTGWINDPNGPFYHNGQYHLFYQHVPDSSEWQWGLVWGHAKSKDMVNWEHLPHALVPQPHTPDQHGCFSGCATVDLDGRPSILYTGVIRKPEPEHGAYENQVIAVATDPSDPDLKEWQQLPGTFLPPPPADMDVTGWRDPFILERPSDSSPWWYVMVGAGVKQKLGTAMVYRSKHLKTGWEYVGNLCESTSNTMWECPIMATLTSACPQAAINAHNGTSDAQGLVRRHMLCISPDYCVNMAQYYLGDYAAGKFDLEKASGPHALDLGDILYAPNLLTDKHGRTVMWGWMQEKPVLRPVGDYHSSCCLCVPRVLYLSPDGSTLLQEPLPELKLLRQQQHAWTTEGIPVSLLPGSSVDIANSVSRSSHLDLELTISKGDCDSVAVVLQPFAQSGVSGAAGAGITYCWKTNTLQVINTTDLSVLEQYAATHVEPPVLKTLPAPAEEDMEVARQAEAAAVAAGTPRRCGGKLATPGAVSSYTGTDDVAAAGESVVSFRILIDGSCVEVFTCSGQALGTRVYRGDEAPISSTAPVSCNGGVNGMQGSTHCGEIQLVSFGPGPALLLNASAWTMSNMWVQQEQEAAEAVVLPQPASSAVTTAAAEVLQGLVAADVGVASAVVLPLAQLAVEASVNAEEMGPMSPAAVVEARA